MSYNQIGTCRLYINTIEWLDSLGSVTMSSDTFRTLPVNPTLQEVESIDITLKGMTKYGFVALLGHNMATTATDFELQTDGIPITLTNVINKDTSTGYNGFSIATFTGSDEIDNISVSNPLSSIGSIIIGTYFDFSTSPDLKLSLEYITGTKNITTKGGVDLSNTAWRPPLWNGLGPWELSAPGSETNTQALAHSSKRVFNLSFSFISKDKMFPKYNALNRLIDQNETVPDEVTLLTSSDFFSAVWNRVGTALPMILQPDNTVNEFAIVKIANKSLKVTQVANQIYTIKLKLVETF